MTTATKPTYTVNFTAIRSSAALKALRITPRWVCWKYIKRGGKWTKPPVQPSGQFAESTNSTFGRAMPTAGAPCGRTVTTWPAWDSC